MPLDCVARLVTDFSPIEVSGSLSTDFSKEIALSLLTYLMAIKVLL